MYLEIFLVDFAVFHVFGGISRVRDRAKYQKPCTWRVVMIKIQMAIAIMMMMMMMMMLMVMKDYSSDKVFN